MTRASRRLAGYALSLAGLLGARASFADSARKTTDGVYGRLDGDLDLSVAAGGTAARGGSGGVVMLRALFLETAGLYASYSDAFGTATSGPPRTLSLGVGIRPLFLPRWGNDLDRGPAVLDLTIDAFTFDLGVLWCSDADGHFTRPAGMELAFGTEIPLFGRAAGPWIGARGALRWLGSELSGSSDAYPALGPAAYLTLAWHFVANVHLVDVGDEVSR